MRVSVRLNMNLDIQDNEKMMTDHGELRESVIYLDVCDILSTLRDPSSSSHFLEYLNSCSSELKRTYRLKIRNSEKIEQKIGYLSYFPRKKVLLVSLLLL